MTTPEPLPCPFCKSKDVNVYIDEQCILQNHCECNDCFAKGPYKDEDYQAIEAWNERKN